VLPTEAPPALTGSEAVAPSRGRPEHRPQRQKQQRPETVAESAGPAEFSPAADEASDEPGPENVPRRRRRRRRGRKNGRREREAAQAGGPPEPSSGDDLEGPTSEAAAVPRAQPETGEEQMAASGSDERRRGRRKRRRRGRKPAAAASEATAELSAESCEISDLEPLNDDEEVESQERVVEAAAAADVDDLEPVAAHPSHHETALLPGGAEDEGDDAGSEKPHRSIPTWEEAVGVVIGANMESRAKSPRPPRGRPRGR
jgi:ribonuclease E